MSSELFEGVSETGDISDALSVAIQNASESLSSSQFVWRLDSVWGNSTGFVKVTLVAATISLDLLPN